MSDVTLKARCKVNLGLDVLSKRPDGYHDVRMIMQTVELHDTVTLCEAHDIFMRCDIPELPCDERNLCMKAARLMAEEYDLSSGVKIDLQKRIPQAAGLGGGSSDAAAVLMGINQLFDLDISQEELIKLGARIGADVPYFMMGGTVLCEGIGDELTPINPIREYPIILAKPGIGVSTKFVYENLKTDEVEHPNIDALIRGIDADDTSAIISNLGNVLESVTVKEYPVIADIKNIMKVNGALGTLMSGSGPTVFAIFEDEESRNRCYKAITSMRLAKEVYATKFVSLND